MKESLKKFVCYEDVTIQHCLKMLDRNASKIIFIVDKDLKLIGSLTDGDVRRGLLSNCSLNQNVKKIMNQNPRVINENKKEKITKVFLQKEKILGIPVIDNKKQIKDVIVLLGEESKQQTIKNDAVIMAGGFGKRLLPLTKKSPKPLLKINGKSILEMIIKNLSSYGFINYKIITHYKSELIEEFLKNNNLFNLNIELFREENPMGTIGGLYKLKKKISSDFVVTNGDIVTDTNFSEFVNFHKNKKSIATFCIKEIENKIDFGVITLSKDKIDDILEKPNQKYFINAGIYCFKKRILDYFNGEKEDIISLFSKLKKNKEKVSAFPIHERWEDIGTIDSLGKLRK